MARFYNYSFNNVLLIASQRPNATHVAGVRGWNKLGRLVKKGEKGIMILAPLVAGKQNADATADQRILLGFRAVYVFDISQTEGEELPELPTVQGDPSAHRDRLVKFVADRGILLSYSAEIAPAKGLSQGGAITLLPDMTPAEEFATLVHEVAHEMLHRGERRALTTKRVRETEAEAVAHIICNEIGLTTGSATQDYIQLFDGDDKLLIESLQVIQETAGVVLGALSSEHCSAIPIKTANNHEELSTTA